MPPFSWGLFFLGAFGAEVIGTMAGFGAATVLTPIAGFFMSMKTAVAVVACFHLFGNASRLVFFWRAINWRIVGQFGLPGVLCSIGGAQLAASMPSQAIRILLGAFLLIYATAEAWRLTAVRIPASRTALRTGGIASGLIAGMIGTGGAIRSMCLLAFALPKESYLGTSAVIALLVDATRLPVYLTQGFIPHELAWVIAVLIGVAFCGSWLGQRLVRRVPADRFKQFVLMLLGLMGIKLVLDGLQGVA